MNERSRSSDAAPEGDRDPAREEASLTGSQRKFLRGLAHALEPVVQVGRGGVTEPVLEAVRRALADHELVKVKLAAPREERSAMAAAIEKGCDAEVVGRIGGIAIVYRAQPDPARRRIHLR